MILPSKSRPFYPYFTLGFSVLSIASIIDFIASRASFNPHTALHLFSPPHLYCSYHIPSYSLLSSSFLSIVIYPYLSSTLPSYLTPSSHFLPFPPLHSSTTAHSSHSPRDAPSLFRRAHTTDPRTRSWRPLRLLRSCYFTSRKPKYKKCSKVLR